MPILSTRGSEFGICNICGTYGKLTEDHTPPRGCVKPAIMTIEHVSSRLGARHKPREFRILQNGVRYRTLCSRCNNTMLGSRYDLALIQFTRDVSAFLESPIALASTVYAPTKPALLARAVWGHMAAQGVDRYLKGPRTEELRDWFLDDNLPFPANVQMNYWVYPFRRQVLMRDVATQDLRAHGHAMYWLMKFYPIAFAFWQPDDPGPKLRYRDLGIYRATSNMTFDVPIDTDDIPHELILEAPTRSQMIMLGESAIVARARNPKSKTILLPDEIF